MSRFTFRYENFNCGKMDDEEARKRVSSIECSCGGNEFFINFLLPKYETGGYLKLTCSKCGHTEVVYDNYA